MFRRKASQQPDDSFDESTGEVEEAGSADGGTQGSGPWDSGDAPGDDIQRVDLGSLFVAAEEGRELRLQVDEQTGEVQSVLLAGEDGAVEVRAFAAARNGDLWGEVRPQIAADVAQRGGTATEREGRWGTELVCQMPAQMPDGTAAYQPSRIVGINGERWMLRATFLGRPAVEPESADSWEDAVTRIIVHRGTHAMPPGDALPVTLPSDARRMPDQPL